MAIEFPERIKFRLFNPSGSGAPLVLVTEPYGREIPIDSGKWVDVECINGEGAPAEIEVRSDGALAVYGRTVIVTDEGGEERVH
jgi:hypothetical protein